VASRRPIVPGMPIIGSDGALVGLVDRVMGVRIQVQKTGVSDADRYYIPVAWVTGVTDRVTLDRSAVKARIDSAGASKIGGAGGMGPALWAGLGLVLLGSLYGGYTLLKRGPAMRQAATASAGDVGPTIGVDGAPAVAGGSAPLVADVAAPTTPQSIAEFLNSNSPVPQAFSLDAVSFAPGSAVIVGAAEKAVEGIASILTTHLNARIKLATLPGGGTLAVRRVMAIKSELVDRGVAEYRIVTGPERGHIRDAKSGIAMIVLAK
jgi:hypothetical protein